MNEKYEFWNFIIAEIEVFIFIVVEFRNLIMFFFKHLKGNKGKYSTVKFKY